MITKLTKGVLAGFVVFLFLAPSPVFAHAPKQITLAFEMKTSGLKVDIQHPVKNPEKHYIKRIRIYRNGEMVQEKTCSSQKSAEGQTDAFTLKNVKVGDEIMVKATCSKFGGKRTKLKVT